MRRLWVSVLVGGLVGCSGETTGRAYRGEPLFTIGGQLELRGAAAPSVPIRLAVAWYPDQRAAASPKAIVPQDVEYQGSFPLKYTFSFYELPPPGAVQPSTENGHTVGTAWGVLIAYDDVNGNGRLDSIPLGGSPIDHVLGTSVGDTYNGNGAAAPVYVVYLDDEPPPEWSGFSGGYNLWRGGEVVSPSTAVVLPLDDTAELSLFVCDEFFSSRSGRDGLPCNIAPTGGVRVVGSVYESGGVPVASVSVSDGVSPLPAQVVVNGVSLPWHPEWQGYELDGPPLVVNAPGVNEVRVTVDGGTRVYRVKAPANFTVASPTEGVRVEVGAPLTVRWSAAAGAAYYEVGSYSLSPPYAGSDAELVYASTRRLTSTVPGLPADDYYRVYVNAYDQTYLARGLGGSVISAATTQEVTVDAIAVDAGVRVEGSMARLIYQGSTQDSAYIWVYDGVVEARGAVTVNGQVATFDPKFRAYSVVSSGLFVPEQPTQIVATVPGHEPVTRSVTFPGAFTVTPPPAIASGSQPLTLTWTASSQASAYRYGVTDAMGNQVFSSQTTATTATIPALHLNGDVAVSVSAVGPPVDRHLEATIQAAFDVHLDP